MAFDESSEESLKEADDSVAQMQEVNQSTSHLSKNHSQTNSLPLKKKTTSQPISLGGVSALRIVDARKVLQPSGWIPRIIVHKHLTDEQNQFVRDLVNQHKDKKNGSTLPVCGTFMEVCPIIEDFIGMYNPVGNPSSPVVKKHGRDIAERVQSHYKKQLLLRQQKIDPNFQTLPAP